MSLPQASISSLSPKPLSPQLSPILHPGDDLSGHGTLPLTTGITEQACCLGLNCKQLVKIKVNNLFIDSVHQIYTGAIL